MLTITPTATEAIRVIMQSSDASEEGGIRISVAPDNEAQAALAISISDAPQEGDAVVDQDGAHVSLDEAAASVLDDKALDARIEGDQIAFQVLEQGRNGNGRPLQGAAGEARPARQSRSARTASRALGYSAARAPDRGAVRDYLVGKGLAPDRARWARSRSIRRCG